MKEIGGYFELELRKGEEYHRNAIRLNTGRNAFEYILRAKAYKKVFLPYYTCEVVLEPIYKLEIQYEFYSLDHHLNPILDKELSEDDVVLFTNYFGLKSKAIIELKIKYKNIIVDNTQAFFSMPITGIDTFYSARKFFGVADGAYLYTDCILNEPLEQDISFERFQHLLKRVDLDAKNGYDDFKSNDMCLINQPIKSMSRLTNELMRNIDYESVSLVRKRNFEYLHSELKYMNSFKFDYDSEAVPLIYPLLLPNSLKNNLIKSNIFVATYWPNVLNWCDEDQFEYTLANNLLALPIDQRYSEIDMQFIISTIKNI